MPDENQIVEDALDILRTIMTQYSGDDVSLLAGAMQLQVRNPIFNMRWRTVDGKPSEEHLKRIREALRKSPEEFVEAATRAVEKKRGPTYKTPIFKCLEDFETCKQHSNPNTCLALMVICVGKQLIPFTK